MEHPRRGPNPLTSAMRTDIGFSNLKIEVFRIAVDVTLRRLDGYLPRGGGWLKAIWVGCLTTHGPTLANGRPQLLGAGVNRVPMSGNPACRERST